MNQAYIRVTHGPVFEACLAHFTKVAVADAAVNALVAEFGCTPGRRLSRGPFLEGLHRPYTVAAMPPGWRPAGKKFPGYIKPNTRTAAGKAIQARLDAIKLPVPEDLAALLGFPPFFTEIGSGDFCSAADGFMRGGVYYISFPAVLSRCFRDKPGIEFIKEWEYLKAEDEK